MQTQEISRITPTDIKKKTYSILKYGFGVTPRQRAFNRRIALRIPFRELEHLVSIAAFVAQSNGCEFNYAMTKELEHNGSYYDRWKPQTLYITNSYDEYKYSFFDYHRNEGNENIRLTQLEIMYRFLGSETIRKYFNLDMDILSMKRQLGNSFRRRVWENRTSSALRHRCTAILKKDGWIRLDSTKSIVYIENPHEKIILDNLESLVGSNDEKAILGEIQKERISNRSKPVRLDRLTENQKRLAKEIYKAHHFGKESTIGEIMDELNIKNDTTYYRLLKWATNEMLDLGLKGKEIEQMDLMKINDGERRSKRKGRPKGMSETSKLLARKVLELKESGRESVRSAMMKLGIKSTSTYYIYLRWAEANVSSSTISKSQQKDYGVQKATAHT